MMVAAAAAAAAAAGEVYKKRGGEENIRAGGFKIPYKFDIPPLFSRNGEVKR